MAKLNPVEILFLDYIDGKPTKNPSFPGYWNYLYNSNPNLMLKKIINNGYVKKSDYLFNMQKEKVATLKEILRQNGLKVSGKKAELIKRITENLPESECKKIFNSSFYQHTEKAKELLNQHKALIYFHKRSFYNYDISIKDVYQYSLNYPQFNEYNIMRNLLKKGLDKFSNNKSWGLYRNSLLGIAYTFMDEQKYIESLNLLLEICYRDLSGLGNNNILTPELSQLAPGIISMIQSVTESLQIDNNKLKEIYIEVVNKIELPFHYFTKTDSWEILNASLNNDELAVKKLYKKAKTKIPKSISNNYFYKEVKKYRNKNKIETKNFIKDKLSSLIKNILKNK